MHLSYPFPCVQVQQKLNDDKINDDIKTQAVIANGRKYHPTNQYQK